MWFKLHLHSRKQEMGLTQEDIHRSHENGLGTNLFHLFVDGTGLGQSGVGVIDIDWINWPILKIDINLGLYLLM